MKNYLVGVVLLLVGCNSGAVKPPEQPVQPTPEPVVVEEPVVVTPAPDCSFLDRTTGNPAIDEWLKLELQECLELTN